MNVCFEARRSIFSRSRRTKTSHGPVAMRLAASPKLLQQLVAGRYAALLQGELVQEAETPSA